MTRERTGVTAEEAVVQSVSPGLNSTTSGTQNTTKPRFVPRTFTNTLELYLELKEECEALELDCSFTKDCPNSKEVCEEINTLCRLEPLEVTPYHTETIIKETTTATMTTTKTTSATTTKSVAGGKITEPCTLMQTTDIWVTSTSLYMSIMTSIPTLTSTVIFTSTRKCKPTKCTTDSSKETQKGEERREEEVKLNEGIKIRVPDMIKIMLLGVIVMGMM
ncbi:hypothetical protein T552_03425 [Pneumocystis carinii B80]|uniref:Major surface glycoprotein n=1 Tax=Pneumocystis carinii (strain B80) TaxID=1408658 RepID=A0A0W4ZB39_PNEC8|nr:hypothetical protein T552_03425 [Pneumocystis carinii B80]KTW25565.1 hypothetical protein T552_03425 [Pneumocystis carinii B80]